jgi:hypothetical protein
MVIFTSEHTWSNISTAVRDRISWAFYHLATTHISSDGSIYVKSKPVGAFGSIRGCYVHTRYMKIRIVGEWIWDMVLERYFGSRMVLKLMSVIDHTDEIVDSSRQALSWTYTFIMDTAAPSPQTEWKIWGFQRFQQKYGCRNQIEGHLLTYYSIWARRCLIFRRRK